MKCYNHSDKDAVGVCVKCGKAVCKECVTENSENKIICKSCSEEPINPETTPNNALSNKKTGSIPDLAYLCAAIVIDFADALPLDVIGLGYVYELPLAGVEALFLNSIGVSPIKNAIETGWDLVPIIDAMPWCTLAVLDKKYNVKIPLLTTMFN